MKKLFSSMSNLETHYHFKLDFKNIDQYKEGIRWIHGTKRCKLSLELPCRKA